MPPATTDHWVEFPGHEGYYVSRDGEVKNRSGRILRPKIDGGVPRLRLSGPVKGRSVRIDRAVLEAFVGPGRPDQVIRHKNDLLTDCRLENLEWHTRPGLKGRRTTKAKLAALLSEARVDVDAMLQISKELGEAQAVKCRHDLLTRIDAALERV